MYFVFCFSARKPIDVNVIADRILKAGLAETVGSPAREDVRVAPKYRDLAKILQKAHAYDELNELLGINENQQDESGDGLREAEPSNDTGPTTVMKWMRIHPVLSVQILASVTWGRIKRLFRRAEVESNAERVDLKETIAEANEAVARTQFVSATHQLVESQLFQQEYLAGEPYLRLQMIGTHQWWRMLDGGEQRAEGNDAGGIVSDALLLVHRSGVMQLTIAMALPANLSTDDLISLVKPGSPNLTSAEIPESIIDAAEPMTGFESSLAGHWLPEVSHNNRWRHVDYATPTSVTELFQLYWDSLIVATRTDFNPSWLCYPVVCIDKVECCSSEEQWMENHRRDLAAMISRTTGSGNLRDVAVADLIPQDASFRHGTSILFTEGCTVRIAWPGEETPDFEDHLWTLLLPESALVQYWQLRVLEARLAATLRRQRDVRQVQLEVIYGLEEYRLGRLTYGSATDTVDRLLDRWRANRLHSRILESLDQLQQRVADGDALRAARRANLLATAAAIVAVVLGLPAIKETLDVASGIPEGVALGWLPSRFNLSPIKVQRECGLPTWLSFRPSFSSYF